MNSATVAFLREKKIINNNEIDFIFNYKNWEENK